MGLMIWGRIILIMIGLYLVTLGLWGLRKGQDRKTYVNLMFQYAPLTAK